MSDGLSRAGALVVLMLLLAGTGSAVGPHHPISQIHPADENLSLGGYWLTAVDGLAPEGRLTIDGRLATDRLTTGGITVTDQRITGLLGTGCGPDAVVADLHPNGSFSCASVLMNGSAYLNSTGDTLSGALDMDTNPIRDIGDGGIDITDGGLRMRGERIRDLPEPAGSGDAVRKGYLDSGFLALSGGAMTGSLSLGGHRLDQVRSITMNHSLGDKLSLYGTRLGSPEMYGFGVASGTLYAKANTRHRWYVGSNADGGDSAVMSLSGTGLDLAGHRIENIGPPDSGDDAVPRDYADGRYINDNTGSVNSTDISDGTIQNDDIGTDEITPTELAQDYYTEGEVDSGFVNIGGDTLTGSLDTGGHTLKTGGGDLDLDSGNQGIWIHDGTGNFNIKSGVAGHSNTIRAGTGGSEIMLMESGRIDLTVDESTSAGGSLTTDIGLTLNGDQVTIDSGRLMMDDAGIYMDGHGLGKVGDTYISEGHVQWGQGTARMRAWDGGDRFIMAPYDDGDWQWGREFQYDAGRDDWVFDAGFETDGPIEMGSSDLEGAGRISADTITAGGVPVHETTASHSGLAAGWYTIAENDGDRASARFTVKDQESGEHSAVTFYAAHHYGTDRSNVINIISDSDYGGGCIGGIRIREGGTYEGALLQIHLEYDSCGGVRAMMSANVQVSGWELRDWISGDTIDGLTTRTAVDLSDGIDDSVRFTNGITTQGPLTDPTGNLTVQDSMRVRGTVWVQGADLAELYPGDGSLRPGTIVGLGPDGNVTAAGPDDEPIGVVSTDPGHVMGRGSGTVPVALEGRVPVRVTGQPGIGTRIVPTTDGVGARCEPPDRLSDTMQELYCDTNSIGIVQEQHNASHAIVVLD